MKIKVNDNVLVTTGKNKGKTGRVMRVYQNPDRVTVEKANIVTKHIKKTSTGPGKRIKYEAPMDVSKVMLICRNCSKAARVSYKVPKTGKKFRICSKCKESVEQSISKVEKKVGK